MSEVELDGVHKRFDEGEGAALSAISIAVEKGEFFVVVGPSGCGKSTTLRIVAGLEEEDGGAVRIAGRSMKDVAPQDRDVAMVFQSYALYPQMTVRQNIEFPLVMRKLPEGERRKRSDEAAKMLRLERFMDRLPAELSGGERQRVAMGRAIVRRPRVFLFDEPLSNLDAALRQELRVEIGLLVRRLGATAIYVTHDQVEAMTLADRICVMRKGRIEQVAAPRELYERPATSFVAGFIGAPKMNLFPGKCEGKTIRAGPFEIPAPAGTPKDVLVGVRPEDLAVTSDGAELEVVVAEPLGAETHTLLRAAGDEIRLREAGFLPRERGAKVKVGLSGPVHLFATDEDGKRVRLTSEP